jgi:hypothetical protein
MKRIIKDYKSITKDQLAMIAEEYPDGFGIDDLITFRKPDGDTFKGLEIRTEDAIYLFKINTRMLEMIDDYTDQDYTLDEFSESSDYEFESSEASDDDDEPADHDDDDDDDD